jgi:protein-disulfide isomerase
MNGGRWSDAGTSRRTVLAGLATTATMGAGCLQSNGRLPAPVRGDPDADVTVMAFEDYACPHCRTYSLGEVPQIAEAYMDPGIIRYEFHDFPIPVADPTSWRAANAAREAQDRGGDSVFWEYQKQLFENQARLGPDTFAGIANDMDLDGGAVRKAAVNEQHTNTVQADRKMGQDLGVEGTPTVVVDGEAVRPTAEAISDAIERARSG